MPALDNSGYLTSAFGNLVGNGNTNSASTANSIWQNGAYQPYTINNPMGTTSFSGNSATSSLSPLQAQLQSLFGGTAASNLSGGSSTYNPNTSFLPQQYQSIFGNMQGNVNSQFNALQAAQAPFTQQYLQSNLDNEFSKGTLASTAGAYQTAGAQTAANAQMNANYAQAQNYALNTANSQFGAAQGTAGLGEQQSEFGPQFAQGQTQGLFSDILNQGQLAGQLTGLGGSLGAQQSSSNVNAGQDAFKAAQMQDQAQSGLTNGLLFGNGSGGLLGALLGIGGNGGGSSGGLLGSILGLSGGSSGAAGPLTSGAGLLGSLGSLFNGNVNLNDPGSMGQTNLNQTNDIFNQPGYFNTGLPSNVLSQLQNNASTSDTTSDLFGGSTDGTGGGNDLTNNQSVDTSLDQSNADLASLWGSNADGSTFSGAGGQAATPSGTSALSNINPLGLATSGLSLAGAAESGNGVGIAGSAANIANQLGVPSSVTKPVQTGSQLAGLGLNLASGNYLGAAGSALGLGSKAGLPSYISQPLALLLSAVSGNPIGMGVNSLKVGSGLLNLIEGLNYNGSWDAPTAQIRSAADTAGTTVADAGNASLNNDLSTILSGGTPDDRTALNNGIPGASGVADLGPTFSSSQLAQIGANQASSFDTSAYMQENAGNYSGQPIDMMNQGEAETPVATTTPQAAMQMAMQSLQQSLHDALGNDPNLIAALPPELRAVM